VQQEKEKEEEKEEEEEKRETKGWKSVEFSEEMIQKSEQQKDYVTLLEKEKEKNAKLREVFKST